MSIDCYKLFATNQRTSGKKSKFMWKHFLFSAKLFIKRFPIESFASAFPPGGRVDWRQCGDSSNSQNTSSSSTPPTDCESFRRPVTGRRDGMLNSQEANSSKNDSGNLIPVWVSSRCKGLTDVAENFSRNIWLNSRRYKRLPTLG